MKKLLSALLVCIALTTMAQNKKYYVNGNTPQNGGGNDANSGLTPELAWKSISKVNDFNFKPGDQILLFTDGDWHNGSFYFQASKIQSTPSEPITISCYGSGARANVYAGGAQGFYGEDVGAVIIKNINFYGGRMYNQSNTNSGINFYAKGGIAHKQLITIDSCRMEGFGLNGIIILSYNQDNTSPKGFSNITIKNTIVKNCGRAGVKVGAFGDLSHAYPHKNVLIQNVRSTGNAGENGFTATATGNGIVVSETEDAIIENCVADDNGALNSHVGGGIAGIWFYNTKNGIIQHCESFGNFAGLALDGNGFGIDGGCQNCTIQYCYSHDNEGCGFGLFEYGSVNPHTNNTIRYNISQKDGRKNRFAAFNVWGKDATHKVTNDNVYNNSVYMNDVALVDVNKLPTGVRMLSNNFSNVKFMNNAFYMNNNLNFTKAVNLSEEAISIPTIDVLMLNNIYYNASGGSNYNWGTLYSTLAAWQTGTGQEKSGATLFGFEVNPGYTSAGTGLQIAGTFNMEGVNQAIPLPSTGDLKNLTQYKLTETAAAKGKGLNIASLYELNIGTQDYYGNSLTAVSSFDIGANQTPTVTPLASLSSFSATVETTGNKLVWVMNNLYNANKFEVEASTDGITFTKVGNTLNANGSLQYSVFDALVSNTTYYRLKGIDTDGLEWFSKVKIADRTAIQEFNVYPNPIVNVLNISLNWSKKETIKILIYNTTGQVVFSKNAVLNQGNNTLALNDVSKLNAGVYNLKLSGSANSLSKIIIKK